MATSQVDVPKDGAGRRSPARSRRGRETVRDMILSLAAIGIVVAVVMVIVQRQPPKHAVRTVNYQQAFDTAKGHAPFTLLEPRGLPSSWRPTSVHFDGSVSSRVSWHVGFQAPHGQYAAVEQGNGPAKKFIAAKAMGGHHEGSQVVDGKTWQRWGGGHYRALVLRSSTSTTMVTGTAGFDELARLARSLRG